MPPRDSQIESKTKPPPAVMTQVISAAHSIASSFGDIEAADSINKNLVLSPLNRLSRW
jgi:hypothetical protein